MHWKRWITALVILPPLLLLILKGGSLLFGLLAIAVSTITQWEYYRIVFRSHAPPVPLVYPLWGYLHGALILAAASCHNDPAMMALLITNWIGAAIFSIGRFKSCQDAPLIVLKQAFGVAYIPLSLGYVLLLYHGAQGPLWFLFVLAVVAAGDTGAYYVGTYWGRHKLAPAVSPKKSIEGAIGGLASNLLFGWLFRQLFLPQLELWHCFLFSIVIGLVGQAGDLFESEFKRAAGVKDSSNLLPGHGGFMDRLDALLFAAPVAFLLKDYLLP